MGFFFFHQSVKNCIYKLWTNFGKPFFNVKLQRCWIYTIRNIRFWESGKISWDNAKDQFWMHMIFSQCCIKRSSEFWFWNGNDCIEEENVQKSQRYHPEMQVKALTCKDEAINCIHFTKMASKWKSSCAELACLHPSIFSHRIFDASWNHIWKHISSPY